MAFRFDDVLNHYDHDPACKTGAEMLPTIWREMENNWSARTITLTKRRVLRPLYLGYYIMRSEKAGCFSYSVVGYDEVKDERVVSTTIPAKVKVTG